ncbi:MAG TPA: DNA ligase D [Kofleriaceae bacterium]|nr:DNA ligase D [Kofleriaceae bacterium]
MAKKDSRTSPSGRNSRQGPRSSPTGEPLSRYREKRTAGATPEPFGGREDQSGRLFVVHKHAARRLHYDLRLQLGGVLVSWAVPKGPSLDPEVKRLAVHVEDHPVEYGDFEGVIPAGNYGAGEVIVWDRGTWVAIEDPDAGLEKGKLLFDLAGAKLRGRFTLVRTARGQGKEWLLIKKPDAYADPERVLSEASVVSGLTVENLASGQRPAEAGEARLAAMGAPDGAVDAKAVSIALCETRDVPFSDPEWLFELKYDGYRVLASVAEGKAALYYRSGRDATYAFPEIAEALGRLAVSRAVIDGEVVALDTTGRPDFRLLQRRAQRLRDTDIRRLAREIPVTLFVFDLLGLGHRDARPIPLVSRKEILREILPPGGPIRYADHVIGSGETFYGEVEAMGLEGVVAKKLAAPYPRGRSPLWLKIPALRTDCFAVVGYTAPKGSRAGFGGLHLAAWSGEEWIYAGKVGSGFTDRELISLSERLKQLPRASYSFPQVPSGTEHTWIEAVLVAEVTYKEWPPDGLLRQSRMIRLVPEADPRACTPITGAHEEPAADAEPPPGRRTPELEPLEPQTKGARKPARLALSNLDKIFFPEDGITKGQLIDYYRAVWPTMGPYLADRPVVLTRYPDGIHGKSFFQKDAPVFVPDWIRTEKVWSEHAEREISYFICDEVDALIYLANLGTIPLHMWSSRTPDLSRPDFSILDLDPKGAPFAHVIDIARAIHRLLEDIELPGYLKTSGASGLHILIPLAGTLVFDESRALAELIARIIEAELPDISTTRRPLAARGGKVYIDFGQNGHGRLLVAPLSVRPLPGAPVSMPIPWRALKKGLSPTQFTILNAPRRLARQESDPMAAVLTDRPNLGRALSRLEQRLSKSRQTS